MTSNSRFGLIYALLSNGSRCQTGNGNPGTDVRSPLTCRPQTLLPRGFSHHGVGDESPESRTQLVGRALVRAFRSKIHALERILVQVIQLVQLRVLHPMDQLVARSANALV